MFHDSDIALLLLLSAFLFAFLLEKCSREMVGWENNRGRMGFCIDSRVDTLWLS